LFIDKITSDKITTHIFEKGKRQSAEKMILVIHLDNAYGNEIIFTLQTLFPQLINFTHQ
jgi:hypothetical protein